MTFASHAGIFSEHAERFDFLDKVPTVQGRLVSIFRVIAYNHVGIQESPVKRKPGEKKNPFFYSRHRTILALVYGVFSTFSTSNRLPKSVKLLLL